MLVQKPCILFPACQCVLAYNACASIAQACSVYSKSVLVCRVSQYRNVVLFWSERPRQYDTPLGNLYDFFKANFEIYKDQHDRVWKGSGAELLLQNTGARKTSVFPDAYETVTRTVPNRRSPTLWAKKETPVTKRSWFDLSRPGKARAGLCAVFFSNALPPPFISLRHVRYNCHSGSLTSLKNYLQKSKLKNKGKQWPHCQIKFEEFCDFNNQKFQKLCVLKFL